MVKLDLIAVVFVAFFIVRHPIAVDDAVKFRLENNRYQIKFDHNHQLTDKLSGGINFNQVSDDNYYRDFYGREDIASNVNLNRQLWLNYGDNIWGGSF